MALATATMDEISDHLTFDAGFLAAIERNEFHPFILVRTAGEGPLPQRYIICPTQNDAGQFVNELAALPLFASMMLVRAIERALQLEIYDAAGLFFDWVRNGSGETLYVGLPDNVDLSVFWGYPAFEVGSHVATTRAQRIRLLADAFEAYASTTGNDGLRAVLIEALAFGLCRALGAADRHTEGLVIVDRALSYRPYSIHLKAAKHALTLRIQCKAVPHRLIKFIGEDNGYLKQFVCPEPFTRFDIGPDGGVLVCCGHWLPTSIGNFLKDPINNILNSATAQKIRSSVTDGSYKYCNHLECGLMNQDALPAREAVQNHRVRDALDSGSYHVDGVDQVLFALDQSCNLSCPSCRRERILEKASQSDEKVRAVEDKLLPLLSGLKVLDLNPAGELFASKPSRKILSSINDENCPDLVLDIISNGTLFTEEEWNKFPGIHGKVRSIRISVDAARKDTFEKLRRLGDHESFIENMHFLSRLRVSGVIPQLKFSFTYQRDNFREMAEFVEFAQSLHCDFVIFERLQNLGAFSREEYLARAVHYQSHPLYAAFIEMIKDPIFCRLIVYHEFDYEGVEHMRRERHLRINSRVI